MSPWTVARQAPLSMDSPGKNIGVGCHFLLQRIFLTQGLNSDLLHCRQILYWLSYDGSPSTYCLNLSVCFSKTIMSQWKTSLINVNIHWYFFKGEINLNNLSNIHTTEIVKNLLSWPQGFYSSKLCTWSIMRTLGKCLGELQG